MRKMNAKLFVAAAVAASAMMFTACGGSKQETTAAETTAAETTAAAQAETVTPAKPESMGTVTLGNYKGIELEEHKIEVTDEEVDSYIESVLEYEASTKEVDRPAENGDTVNIDYVGKMDGKAFEGGSAEGYDLTLGTGKFIDGFEEGLVGHKVGEKGIELKLAFPLNYSEEKLQGKDVVFTVTINSATRMVQPEYNDAFVKTLGDYKNTKEYEKAVEEKLYKQKEEEAQKNMETEVWSKVLAKTKVLKYPEEVVNHYVETFDALTDYNAEQYGLDRKDFIAQYYGAATEKDLKLQLVDYAQTLVKQEMLVEYIADKEGITYTDEEAAELQKNIETQGYTDESVQRDTGRTMDQYVHIELLYEKVLDFLGENAKLK